MSDAPQDQENSADVPVMSPAASADEAPAKEGNMALVFEGSVEAPRKHVWYCLTDNIHLQKWWSPDVKLLCVMGGAFREPWRDTSGNLKLTRGEVVGLDEGRRLVLKWWDEGWADNERTFVDVTLIETEKGTSISLVHSGWDVFGEYAEGMAKRHMDGWIHHLKNLKEHCEKTKPET